MSALRVVVTGVSRGLGRAMLDEFASHGHVVHGCATSPRVIDELKQTFPRPHTLEVVDVSDADQVSAWADTVFDYGAPDLVINNAALMNTTAVLWEVPTVEFTKLMKVNVSGTFHVIQSFVPRMIREGRGVIVNFSSGWGRSTSPEVVPYCASKWAIEGLSRGLAQELPRGMACVAINPGIIYTDMLASCFGASASSYSSPGEWAARAVPFLLSLDASDNGRSVDVPS